MTLFNKKYNEANGQQPDATPASGKSWLGKTTQKFKGIFGSAESKSLTGSAPVSPTYTSSATTAINNGPKN